MKITLSVHASAITVRGYDKQIRANIVSFAKARKWYRNAGDPYRWTFDIKDEPSLEHLMAEFYTVTKLCSIRSTSVEAAGPQFKIRVHFYGVNSSPFRDCSAPEDLKPTWTRRLEKESPAIPYGKTKHAVHFWHAHRLTGPSKWNFEFNEPVWSLFDRQVPPFSQCLNGDWKSYLDADLRADLVLWELNRVGLITLSPAIVENLQHFEALNSL